MSLPQDFPASLGAMLTKQAQEQEKANQTTEICGHQHWNAFSWYDPNSHSWRTYQHSLITNTLDEFLQTWPKAGGMLNGIAYQHHSLERCKREVVGGALYTPVAVDGKGAGLRKSRGAPEKNLRDWFKGKYNLAYPVVLR